VGVAVAWVIGGPRFTIVSNGSLDQGGNTVERSCDSCGPPEIGQIVLLVVVAYALAAGGFVIWSKRN
jgi:hypothetical protein